MIALAVFFIHSTPPVVAEPDDSITVWSATLTVKGFTVIHDGTGCRNGGLANHACSSTSVLSDDEFTYDGVDYKVEEVFLRPSPRNSYFDFGFNKAATNLKASGLTLHVGGRRFALADATLSHSTKGNHALAQWYMPGLSWSVNQQVSLSLKAPALQDQQETPPEEDEHADLIAQMYQWREDPQWRHYKAHTDRWDRALLAFGETVADTTLTPMTAAQAQALADQDWGTRWVPVAAALWELENQAPTVSSAIADATIVNEHGTEQVSLSGVFRDADNDALAVTAASSDETKATVAVASDGSSLTVNAQARGTATITVTADDSRGGTVADAFTVTVKAAPVVASGISDISGLAAGASQDVSLSGVFSDADGDALTLTATSSNNAKATVTVAADQSTLTVAGVAEGTATITVTARDADGNRVAADFAVAVAKKYAALIAQMYQWRNDSQWVSHKSHTDRWDRALLAFGETVADTTLTPMTAAQAQALADQDWGTRWVPVAAALWTLEAAGQAQ